MEGLMVKAQELFTQFGFNIIAAIVIFIVGRWIAKLLKKLLQKVMTRKNVDVTVVDFVGTIVYVILLIFVILAAIGKLGVQTASLVALLGAAGGTALHFLTYKNIHPNFAAVVPSQMAALPTNIPISFRVSPAVLASFRISMVFFIFSVIVFLSGFSSSSSIFAPSI